MLRNPLTRFASSNMRMRGVLNTAVKRSRVVAICQFDDLTAFLPGGSESGFL